ncbi:hypothetical protein [Comamonas sp.]
MTNSIVSNLYRAGAINLPLAAIKKKAGGVYTDFGRRLYAP